MYRSLVVSPPCTTTVFVSKYFACVRTQNNRSVPPSLEGNFWAELTRGAFLLRVNSNRLLQETLAKEVILHDEGTERSL